MRKDKERARPAGDTAEQAAETGSASRADTTSSYQYKTDGGTGQAGIAGLLMAGAENGLHLKELSQMLGIDPRIVRQMIQAERLRGIPILSNNQDGYFLPGNEAERDAFVRSMRHRADEIHRAAEAVEKAGLG